MKPSAESDPANSSNNKLSAGFDAAVKQAVRKNGYDISVQS